MSFTAADLDAEEELPRLLADLATQVSGLDEREAARRSDLREANEIRRESDPRPTRAEPDG